MYLDAKLSSSKQQRGDKEGLIRTSPKQTTFAFSVSEFDSVLAPGSFSGGEFQSGNTSIGDNALETTSYVVNEPEVISNPSTSDFGGGDDHSADRLVECYFDYFYLKSNLRMLQFLQH